MTVSFSRQGYCQDKHTVITPNVTDSLFQRTALGIVLELGKTYTELASDETLKKLFLKIGYSGPILEEGTTKWYPSGEMDRKYLRNKWSMILYAMVKVFSTKTTGWNGIPTYIKKLTHSLIHGYKVDVRKLLMAHLRAAIGKKVSLYPRFLMLYINSLCHFDDNAPRIEVYSVLKRNTHTTLTSQNLNAHIPLCFTKHMVDQVPNLDFPLPSGYETFSLEDETGLDPNSVNPHSTPYIQPRFSRLPKVQIQALQESIKRPLETGVGGSTESQEGVHAPSASNKEVSQTEPIVVPLEPKKKRAKRTKTTVSHPIVSQKTVEENRALNTSLDVPSQQGTSIETGMCPKAPCTESAQPHEEPPLAETHMESGHSEDFFTPIDASQVHSVEQPIFSYPPSPSSFPTHSFVSSPQPKEGDSPNPSSFDHPSPIMDEPPSSGPQEPISQSEMDTTPPNIELEQGTTLPESETTSALFNLQGESYLREDTVTTSVAVKDTAKVVVPTQPAIQDVVNPTVTPSANSNISGKAIVPSTQPNYDEVLIEDVSDDDVPLSQFLKPNELSNGEGLEHVQSDFEGVHIVQALGLESLDVRSDEITQKNHESVRNPSASMPHSFPSPPRRLRTGGTSTLTARRLEALETRCLSMEAKLDSLSTLVATGFAVIQGSIQTLAATFDAANLPKGEKMARSEPILEQGGVDKEVQKEVPVPQGESGSKGESGRKREQLADQQASGAGNLFEYEIDGETVLMSKEVLEELQGKSKSKRPILPPVSIKEQTPQPRETELQKKWREKEEQNKLGKGKGKLSEYCNSPLMWTEGTEIDQEEANTLMVDYRESTLHNQDEQINRVIEEVIRKPSLTPTQVSTSLMDTIVSVCVNINEEIRWTIDVYLDTGLSMFITMQLLQNLHARVLSVMKAKIKANHSTFNEILQVQIQNLMSDKLPEVYLDPFCVCYGAISKEGVKRCAYLDLQGTSRMETKTVMKVLNVILKSKINKERVLAVKAIHKLLARRNIKLSSKVKELISKANANRADQGESCAFDDSLDDDELDGSGGSGVARNVGGTTAGNTENQAQDTSKEEAPEQRKKDADVVTKDDVKKDEDTVMKDPVKEDTVKEDTVMEDVVKDETKEVVKPKRTKSLARAWKLRKPIQTRSYNSFDLLEKEAQEIKNIEVKLDDQNEASQYVLWFDQSRSIKVHKDLTMEVISHEVTEAISRKKRIVTRRIEYFYLERIVNLMQSYDNVPDRVMEHVLIYKAERDEEFYQKYGDWSLHDDADIAHLLEYSDEEIADYEDDFHEEEMQAMPSQEKTSKAVHDVTVEENPTFNLGCWKTLSESSMERKKSTLIVSTSSRPVY
ncbi:hypothetical protein POM88_044272 [Heracleum sosnowskyi]|uniref:Uncharacterized protein n=1 Tax=Heracleum sosnowskyi TaxID=360622 RepID=A0AAD8H422_9APIA|nr:hypothetical protein POM88_044272 [Heracleum sosnowskyi]